MLVVKIVNLDKSRLGQTECCDLHQVWELQKPARPGLLVTDRWRFWTLQATAEISCTSAR